MGCQNLWQGGNGPLMLPFSQALYHSEPSFGSGCTVVSHWKHSPPSLFKAALDLSFCSFVKWVFFSPAFLIKFLEKCSGQHLRLRIDRNKSMLFVWLALEFSLPSCSDNPTAGITAVYRHTLCWGWNPGLCVCQANTLPPSSIPNPLFISGVLENLVWIAVVYWFCEAGGTFWQVYSGYISGWLKASKNSAFLWG